ncbi:hypothetical protein FQR65_LT15278 [Abscondita terminalis]|nr:hypothetical protein FQR65_LT15278 [Abscondita terminalis]
MKRVKESGAEFCKKKAKKEADAKKSQGALLKYLSSSSGSKATSTSSVASCSSGSDSSTPNQRFIEMANTTITNQGFDPIGIRHKLTKTKGFSVDEITKLIYIFLARGTNLDKIKATMTPEGREFLSKASSKYDLKSKIAGGKKDTVDLARLAACFPVCVVGALKKCSGQISRPFAPSEYEIASKVPFPMLMCWNVTAGVIPKNEFEGVTHEDISTIKWLITLQSI